MSCDVDKYRKRRHWERRVTDVRQDAWSVGFENRGQVASHWWLETETTQSNSWFAWLDDGILLSPSNPLNPRETDVFFKHVNGSTICWVTVSFTGYNEVQPDSGPGHTVELLLVFNIYDPILGVDEFWRRETTLLVPAVNRAFAFNPVEGNAIPIDPINPPIGFWDFTPLDACHDCPQ